ncbi:MAG: FapA family protein [Lachnospiraceae bacterium]|nr:FapA family protein [Lachnospiraceae bacterium]MDE6251262.1 FapA family protein [Lachnospiraceae bacterium]
MKINESPNKDNINYDNFVLDISKDHMSASLTVFKDSNHDYTYNEIISYLNRNKIVYGIDTMAVQKIAGGECFYEAILVAKGTPQVDGINGHFEFTFDLTTQKKPIIQEDGSVDYNTLGKLPIVEKDQLLATYHPMVEGSDGKNIFGEVLKAKKSFDLPPLKLINTSYDPDTLEYHALIEGKVSIVGKALKVTPVLEINGDLDAITGNIEFRGDVHVKGNVFSNAVINTTGNITIDGHVETATLIAGKNVILKNGMQGSGIGRIKCGGGLMAKFLEQTIVDAGGNISTNAILNCDVSSGKSVSVAGSRGTIVGGKISAVESINAHVIGNSVGITTKIVIGLESDYKTEINIIDNKISEYEKKLTEATDNLKRITYEMNTSNIPSLKNDRIAYMREKILNQGKLNELINQRNSLIDIRQRSMHGKVVIDGFINPGTIVTINAMTENINSKYKNVTITRTEKEIRIRSNALD